MGTVAIFNGFGHYETAQKNQYEGALEGQKGIALTYGGLGFWFPYQQVTYIPDFTMRNLDENESLFETGGDGLLVYKTFRLSGERLAEELLDTQIPVANKEKGLLKLSENNAKTGKTLRVFAGVNEGGQKLYAEVLEVAPTEFDVAEADRLALSFKQKTIQEYFQSKRERMAGGPGRLTPSGLITVFMEELGVKDIDDVFAQKNSAGDIDRLINALLNRDSPKPTAPPVVIPPAAAKPQQGRPQGAQQLV